MNNAAAMGGVNRGGEGCDKGGGLAGGLGCAGELLAEGSALDELHGEVGAAGEVTDVVNLNDVWVAESGGGFGLLDEAG